MAISSTKLPYQNQNKNSSTHQINLSQIDFYPSIPESLKIEANWNLHSPPPSFKPITGLRPIEAFTALGQTIQPSQPPTENRLKLSQPSTQNRTYHRSIEAFTAPILPD
ncbi:hypothetical protein E3N88_31603 [Mikania micrantha]|uniref:Uncharacterized protein n=1 Tax=Mikania micrantha TaxID=192012 RepID=A0A5N6M659_9ASTR|nr:hypothetical protein E3N88_31603 [Mikania micrantha]